MPECDDVKKYLTDLCACETTGAKIIKLSDRKYAIMDLDAWCDELSHCVNAKFSNASVNIRPCEGSTSGFKVVCTFKHSRPARCMEMTPFSIFVFLFVLYTMASAAVYHYCVPHALES